MRLRPPRTILAAFANALLLLVATGAPVWDGLGRLMSPDRNAWAPCVSERS